VLQPLAGLSLSAGLTVFLVLSLGALAIAGALAWRLLAGLDAPSRLAVTVAAVALLPGAEALAFGQWDPLLLLAAVAPISRLRRGDDLAGGLLLSLLWVKPQVVWLALALLVVQRHWRSSAGLILGGAAWIATGIAIVGPGGVADWWSSVTPGRVAETGKSVGLPSLVTELTSIQSAAFAASVVLAVVAVVACRRAGRLDAEACVCAGLALSVTLSPHVFDTDLLLLAPALLLLARRRGTATAIGLCALLGAAYLVDLRLPDAVGHTTAFAMLAVCVLSARAGLSSSRSAPDVTSGGGGRREAGALKEEAVQAVVAGDLGVERQGYMGA
jgi:hypothetical protein